MSSLLATPKEWHTETVKECAKKADDVAAFYRRLMLMETDSGVKRALLDRYDVARGIANDIRAMNGL